MADRDSGASFTIGLFLGVAVGVAVGFLYAPKTGKETRALLKEKANPDIEALKAKLEKTQSEYNLKKKELKDSISSLKNIRRLLARKSKLLLTGDEISVWNKRIGDLEKKINSLHNELDRLKSQTRLIKTEIKILKQ